MDIADENMDEDYDTGHYLKLGADEHKFRRLLVEGVQESRETDEDQGQ
jgi:hypothetical protein